MCTRGIKSIAAWQKAARGWLAGTVRSCVRLADAHAHTRRAHEEYDDPSTTFAARSPSFLNPYKQYRDPQRPPCFVPARRRQHHGGRRVGGVPLREAQPGALTRLEPQCRRVSDDHVCPHKHATEGAVRRVTRSRAVVQPEHGGGHCRSGSGARPGHRPRADGGARADEGAGAGT